MKEPYIIDTIKTETGDKPVISTEMRFADILGIIKVRLGIKRSNYIIEPGIYAVGNPDKEAPVFVSVNYKYSFDVLRKNLNGIDSWILVLDTKGINVWCAAGKGTFGTEELVSKVSDTRLSEIVSHRDLVVPQLGASGVSGYRVKMATGFNVLFGPVKAADISDYIKNGRKAAAGMRRVEFSIFDRLVLIPMELVIGFKYFTIISIIFFILAFFTKAPDSSYTSALNTVWYLLAAYSGGAVLGPLLLPWIPGRSFSFKGFFIGFIIFIMLLLKFSSSFTYIEILAWFLIMPAISSFMTMNFTGASTYTSPSGVKKEMKIALPIQISGFVSGTILWIIARFI